MNELAFGTDSPREDDVKVSVLAGHCVAGDAHAVAAYRRIHEAETADADRAGISDVYEIDRDR